MATGPTTLVSDVVVPTIFAPYMQVLTEQKTRIIRAGALVRNALIDQLLAGGGLTFNVPSFKDLDDDADNVSTDAAADSLAISASAGVPAFPGALTDAIPAKIGTFTEIAVRLSRNKGWGDSDLATALAGADPGGAIASRVSDYWARRLQDTAIAMVKGICKDNGANDSGDYANDIASTTYVAGTTDFSAEAFLDAELTMGDSGDDLSILMVHSVVYNRMRKNNLIDFIPDARGEVQIATFLGRQVVVDDNMPSGTGSVRSTGSAGDAGVYESWIFGPGALQLGMGNPKMPVETRRYPEAGNGGGMEALFTRQEWCIHMPGHAYIGVAPNGGPDNTTSTHMLNVAGSWNRVYPERKQVKFARLVTRES